MDLDLALNKIIRLSQPQYNQLSSYKVYNSALANKIIENKVEKFIKLNIDLINNNNFQDFYLKIYEELGDDARYIIPECSNIFHQCDINDLGYMDFLPPYYLYGDPFMIEFTIPANIREIHPDAFKGAINLNKIIWKTKSEDNISNSLPSMFDMYYIIRSTFHKIIVEFPKTNYNKKWVGRLKEFLKIRSKMKVENYSKCYIKFADSKKIIKIS